MSLNKIRALLPAYSTVKVAIYQDASIWAASAGLPAMTAITARTVSQWRADLLTLAVEQLSGSTDSGWRSVAIPSLPAIAPPSSKYLAVLYDASGTVNPTDLPLGYQEFYWDGTKILPGAMLDNNSLAAVTVDGTAFLSAVSYVAAGVQGKCSGVGTGSETYKRLDGTTSFVATIDVNGNRTNIVRN